MIRRNLLLSLAGVVFTIYTLSGNASAAIDALSGSGDTYDLGDSFRKSWPFSSFGPSH